LFTSVGVFYKVWLFTSVGVFLRVIYVVVLL